MNKGVDVYLTEGCGRCNLVGTPKCKVHTWNNELVSHIVPLVFLREYY